MKESGIYMIQSKSHPDRKYIGSAVNIQERWWAHRTLLRKKIHKNRKLQGHFNKYGESDLMFLVLICCDKEDLIKHEQFFIDALNPSFNMCKKAGSKLGFRHSKETIERLRILNKRSDETRVRMRLSHLGKPSNRKGTKTSEETKRKLRESHKGQIPWNKGKPQSEEHRRHNSECRKGRRASEETKQKMRESQRKRFIKAA